MTTRVHAGVSIFGSTSHPKSRRATAAKAIGTCAGDIRQTDMWPWVFLVLGHIMQRAGGVISEVNHDVWASWVLAKHVDYSSAGVLRLAQKLLRAAQADTNEEVKAIIAGMPADIVPPEHAPAPAGEEAQTTAQDRTETRPDGGNGNEEERGAGPSKANADDTDRARRTTLTEPDYAKLGGPGDKGGTSRKRPSTHSPMWKVMATCWRPLHKDTSAGHAAVQNGLHTAARDRHLACGNRGGRCASTGNAGRVQARQPV